ncbi:MAG: DegV family protein [Eubacteriales bacterium]
MSIKLITDSACDLPENIIKKYNIDVAPLSVHLGEEEFLDGVSIKSKKVLEDMREGKVYKTSQPTPQAFIDILKKYAEEKESCLYVGFSSGLSGTFESGMLAKEQILEDYPDFDIDIIDTKCASIGFGIVVLKAAQMIEEGKTKEEIIKAVKFYSEHMEHIVTVDDLEYLYRGGRVSRTSAFLGGLLNIKPIIEVKEGKLIPFEKIRGRNKVMKRMVEIMKDRGVDLKNQLIGIAHGDDIEGADKLKDIIKETFGCEDFLVSMLGSAIGAHAGPGTIAIFFLNEKSPY